MRGDEASGEIGVWSGEIGVKSGEIGASTIPPYAPCGVEGSGPGSDKPRSTPPRCRVGWSSGCGWGRSGGTSRCRPGRTAWRSRLGT